MAVRAQYRYSEIWNALLIGVIMTVAMPFIAWKLGTDGGWYWFLLPVVAVPVSWWYVLVHVRYRMELTDTHLTLRALLGLPVRIPLDDVAEVGAPAGRGAVKVVRRDGRWWPVYAGGGLVEFVDEVARAAPNAENRLSSMQRGQSSLYRFFGDRG